MAKSIKSHLEDLGLDGVFLAEDDSIKCYEVFIEFVLGPEASGKTIDQLTDEQKKQVETALSLLGDEFERLY